MRRVVLATAAAALALALGACSGSPATAPAATPSAPVVLPAGFVRLADVAPDVVQEMRYAGEHNFIGRPVAGYDAASCWLTREAADAVAEAQAAVAAEGYSLKAYDCFRPTRAVADFVAWAKDAGDAVTRAEFYPRLAKEVLFPQGFIAEKSGHSRGSTLDVTLVPAGVGTSPTWEVGDAQVDCAAPAGTRFADTSLDMGTGFDCFDPLAATASTGVPAAATANRALLVKAMTAAGFTNLPSEWWHWTLVDEPYPGLYLDAAITG